MPRPPRLEFPGAVYHVTTRGNERRPIFRDDYDREDFLGSVAHYRDKFHFQLLAYCLMTNHVHLAIRPAEVPLSRIMAGLLSTHAQRFNRRHRRVGHLFQGRYKSRLVQEDRHLIALIRYVNRNPVQAGIVSRASDYPWSSDPSLRSGSGPSWLAVDHALSFLAPTRLSAIDRYVELVDGPSSDAAEADLPAVAQAIEGDEAFAAELLAAAGELAPPLLNLTEDKVVDAVAKEVGLSTEELAGPRKGGQFTRARWLAAYLASRLGGIPVRRIARRLKRDDSSFVRPLARFEQSLETDPVLRAHLDRILTSLRETNRSNPDQPTRQPAAKSTSQD